MPSAPIARIERQVAVLPQALQRAVRPAEALLGEAANGRGRFRPGDRPNCRSAPIALLLHADRQILIFGQRVGAESAHRISAERATRRPRPESRSSVPSAASARRSRFCATIYSSACQRVIMLVRLPTFALPATAPTLGSANQRTSRAIVSRLELRVGVERDNDLAARAREAGIQRVRLAAIGECAAARRADRCRTCCCTTSDVRSCEPSSTTMISKIAMVALQNSFDGPADDFLFVVGGHDHRHVAAGPPAQASCLRNFAARVPQAQCRRRKSSREMPSQIAAMKAVDKARARTNSSRGIRRGR